MIVMMFFQCGKKRPFRFLNKILYLFLFRLTHKNQQILNQIQVQLQQQIKEQQVHKKVELLEVYSIVLGGKGHHKCICLMIKIKQ
jgi:hypothetical protein